MVEKKLYTIKQSKNQNKILIIYQSIAEITFIIQLLKKHSFGTCVLIITGGKHFASVIKRLNIEESFGVEVFEFNGLSLKNPLNLAKMYFNIYYSQDSRKLSNYDFKKTYFFSEYEDFIAPIFLSKKNVNEIILIDNLKNLFSKKKKKGTFKDYLKIFLIQLLQIHINVKINFFTFKNNNKNLHAVKFSRYKLYKKKIKRINPIKYKIRDDFKLKLDDKILKKKNIMYIDSNDEEMVGDEFKVIMNRIFKKLQELNYNIIIKRPTRESLSPSLEKKINFNYISDPTPIELYDLTKIGCVLGFMTSALSKISVNKKVKVCSIINLLSEKKKNEYQKIIYNVHKNFKSEKHKIFYPSSLKSLIKILI